MVPSIKKFNNYKLRVIGLIIFLFLAYHLSLITYNYSYAQPQKSRNVRVLILKGVSSFELYVRGEYEMQSCLTKNVLKNGKGINAKVYTDANGININSTLIKENKIMISPGIGYFYLNNRPLRGGLIVKKENDLSLLVINYLDLEDYVKGVLFHEVSHHWPLEALCAQAVATRTYALYEVEVSKDKDYDVTSDIYSQVYGGRDAERYRTIKAAEATEGLVLTCNAKVFPAYFHATCGGKTEDASELWQIDLPCLKGVDCGFCGRSPHFKWQKVFSKDELIKKLNSLGYHFTSLEGIKILGRDKSGRIRKLKLKSKDGDVVIPAKDFRQLVGARDIRSTNFAVNKIADNIYFEGFGWGHGVGMCQWGAYFMSVKKYKYQDILKFYYPGAEITSFNINP